jgi:hypothetical protein
MPCCIGGAEKGGINRRATENTEEAPRKIRDFHFAFRTLHFCQPECGFRNQTNANTRNHAPKSIRPARDVGGPLPFLPHLAGVLAKKSPKINQIPAHKKKIPIAATYFFADFPGLLGYSRQDISNRSDISGEPKTVCRREIRSRHF